MRGSDQKRCDKAMLANGKKLACRRGRSNYSVTDVATPAGSSQRRLPHFFRLMSRLGSSVPALLHALTRAGYVHVRRAFRVGRTLF
jgi:hypothetical protein